MKECTSRHSDWRFLLRGFSAQLAVCFGDDRLAAQTACFSTRLLTREAASVGRTCDLAVADSAGDDTLRAMWGALADGGTCYLEVRRRTTEPLSAFRKRLRTIGYRDVRFFLPRRASPSAAPRAWIPLDRLAASLVITPEMSSSGFGRRMARTARRTLRFVAAQLGAAQTLVVVAHRPALHGGVRDDVTSGGDVAAADAGEHTPAILAIVREHWQQVSPDSEPKHLTLLLNAPGGLHANKLVAVVLDSASSSPRLVVKLPRSEAAVAALAREAEALARLHERRPGLQTVPRLLFTHRYEGGLALAQSYIRGVPLSHRLSARRHAPLARKMSDWAAGLVESDVSTAAQTRIVASVTEEFERQFGRIVDAGMFRDACDELTALRPLPRTFEQRDFSPWNILVLESGELAVLDWESAEPDGLPVMDLWYGMTYVAFYRSGAMGSGRYVEAYKALMDPSTPNGAITSDTVSRYLAATRVPAAAVRPLRLLTWMLHSRSEYRQMRQLADGTPSEESLRGSLFLKLWAEEMAHAS